jgi:hypothetical protein
MALTGHEHNPEVAGIFLCRDREEARWLAKFARGRFPVDIWAVESADLTLRRTKRGFLLSRDRISSHSR